MTKKEDMAILLLKLRLLNLKMEHDRRERQLIKKRELIKYLKPLFSNESI